MGEMNKLQVRKDYGVMTSFNTGFEDVEALTGSEKVGRHSIEAKFVRGQKGM